MQASRSKAAASTVGSKRRPTHGVHARRESCGPFGAPKNYNSQKAPRCAHTATEAPPPRRRHRNYNSQKALRRHAVERRLSLSKSPRRAGPANGGGTPRPQGGGRSPQSLKRLRIREAKLVTPGHTALWFACHSSPLSNGSHLSQTIAVVPPESREGEKLIDVGK